MKYGGFCKNENDKIAALISNQGVFGKPLCFHTEANFKLLKK